MVYLLTEPYKKEVQSRLALTPSIPENNAKLVWAYNI